MINENLNVLITKDLCDPKWDIIALRHPKTNDKAMFLLSNDGKDIYEVSILKNEETNSWFIDNLIKSQGNVHLISKIDPIFLVLPYVIKHASKNFLSLEEILGKENEFENFKRLTNVDSLKFLKIAFDENSDLNKFKYNNEKLFKWLHKKIDSIVETAKVNDVMALEILSRYLPLDIFNKFSKDNRFTTTKRKSDVNMMSDGKKQKV